ncbi:MAG: hypothetical protein C7B46_19320 [Sulfobacillus benefaciens]|uniref:Uncharacterized protein n=1 Tax=Sulfobacillus benefaciens TaxID=453960 RepID=A0A2T2WZE1_9FIRM|nr:MAG: hypothetical protein C7B46_19320 [Sulfobacillus benefaciens]
MTSATLGFNGLERCGHSQDSFQWFGGALLKTRTCYGDCSYESFRFDRVEDARFSFCKTARKPYDVAVTAALIVIKHHLPTVRIMSDGNDDDWADGRMVCMTACGYGENFRLDAKR